MPDGPRKEGPAREPVLVPTGEDLKAARAWALRALARRMRTVHEIREGIRRKGFSEAAAERVVEELRGSGLLDDAQFAARWVAVRSEGKNLGPLRLGRELRARGVPPEAIRSAIADGLDAETEARLAVKAAVRKMRTAGGSGPRAVAALLRHLRSRGFSGEAIRRALAGLVEGASDAEPRDARNGNNGE